MILSRGVLLVVFLLSGSIHPISRVVVLGIAQDGGIPHIGCNQPICRTQRHFVSSLALLGHDSFFLVDATPDLRDQYSQLIHRYPNHAKKNLFDGIFLTHAHMGHYSGLLYLGKESVSSRQVPIYCSKEMASYLQSNAPWNLLVTNGNIELHPFSSEEEIRVDGFTVVPLEVPHRREFTDTHGYFIRGGSKSLLYIPDIDSWDPIREPFLQWIQKADYALLDGTFYSGDELPGRDMRLVPHPTVLASLSFFAALPPFSCHIQFIHLNHTNPLLDSSSPQRQELEKTRFKVAADWEEFQL